MRHARLGLVALCLASLLAGCGIGAGPVRVEDRPDDLTLGDQANSAVSLARPDQIRDAEELVWRFLAAAADDPETRTNTLRSYFGERGENWTPGEKINVVRVLSGPDAAPLSADRSYTVTVWIQRLGELVNGRIVPVRWEPEKLTFRVLDGFFLDPAASSDLFLPDEILNIRYDDRQLYFRTADGALVTDLRYVPRYLSEGEKADQLIKWLYDGPAPWLDQVVGGKLPAATRPTAKVGYESDGRLVVNLAAPAAEADLERLGDQLYRTLVVSPVTGLEIRIQGRPAQRQPSKPTAQPGYPVGRYAVVDGAVVRLRPLARDEETLRLPAEVNKNVLAVAFSRGEESVALVRREGDSQKLWAGRVGMPVEVDLPGTPRRISQPVWLDHRSDVLLVLVDGKLFQVAGGKATQVQGVSNVTAVSVAPDGIRIALVTNGELEMGALVRQPDGRISVGANQQLVPTTFDRVQNVAFGNRGLVVAATDARGTRIVLMNIDGVLQEPGTEELDSSLQVSQLVSDPQSGAILYEIKDVDSYELRMTGSVPLWHSVVRPGTPAQVKVSAPSFEG